jgi:hypothetical protein
MTFKKIKRFIIGVIGFTILLIGFAMIILPGPAFAMIILPGPAIIVIPIGLAILATEFIWARRLLKKVKKQIVKHTRNKQDDKSRH